MQARTRFSVIFLFLLSEICIYQKFCVILQTKLISSSLETLKRGALGHSVKVSTKNRQ